MEKRKAMNTHLTPVIALALLTLATAAPTACNSTQAKEAPAAHSARERLEISFKFQRGSIASSQYAIWIEDASGHLVRTIYATSFTARGGYKRREDTLPTWVKKARPGQMKADQVDAVTGATPQDGQRLYLWDGTDNLGHRMPAGTYRLCLEGTLYWKSTVLYTGEFAWGSKTQTSVPLKAHYTESPQANAQMIANLKAVHFAQ